MIHVGIWSRTSRHLSRSDNFSSFNCFKSDSTCALYLLRDIIRISLFCNSSRRLHEYPISVLRNWGEIAPGYNKEFAVCGVASNFFNLFRVPEYLVNFVPNSSVCAFQFTCSSRITPRKSNLSIVSIVFEWCFKQEPDSIHAFDMDEIA